MADAHARRGADQAHAIGVLLGAVTDTTIDVTNSFPLPGTSMAEPVPCVIEDDVGVFFFLSSFSVSQLNKNRHQATEEHLRRMADLYSKLDASESVVGWYTTQAELDQTAANNHIHIASTFGAAVVLSLAVGAAVAVTAYTGSALESALVSEAAPVDALGLFFSPIGVEVLRDAGDRVARALLMVVAMVVAYTLGAVDTLVATVGVREPVALKPTTNVNATVFFILFRSENSHHRPPAERRGDDQQPAEPGRHRHRLRRGRAGAQFAHETPNVPANLTGHAGRQG
jgi:hypothetical protein